VVEASSQAVVVPVPQRLEFSCAEHSEESTKITSAASPLGETPAPTYRRGSVDSLEAQENPSEVRGSSAAEPRRLEEAGAEASNEVPEPGAPVKKKGGGSKLGRAGQKEKGRITVLAAETGEELERWVAALSTYCKQETPVVSSGRASRKGQVRVLRVFGVVLLLVSPARFFFVGGTCQSESESLTLSGGCQSLQDLLVGSVRPLGVLLFRYCVKLCRAGAAQILKREKTRARKTKRLLASRKAGAPASAKATRDRRARCTMGRFRRSFAAHPGQRRSTLPGTCSRWIRRPPWRIATASVTRTW